MFDVPAADGEGKPETSTFTAGPATTLNGPLAPLASVSPVTRVPVITAPICAVVNVSPLAVHVFPPAGIVQLVAPLSGPVPVVNVNETCVAATTLAGAPAPFRAWTTTENPTAAVTGLPPLTLVTAICEAPPPDPGATE